jgi:hypothetical protein
MMMHERADPEDCGNVYWVHLIRFATDLYHINEYSAPISAGHVRTTITVGSFCVATSPMCYYSTVPWPVFINLLSRNFRLGLVGLRYIRLGQIRLS